MEFKIKATKVIERIVKIDAESLSEAFKQAYLDYMGDKEFFAKFSIDTIKLEEEIR